MHIGKRLASLLARSGVSVVFGIPGAQTRPLYEGIYDSPSELRHVLMHDERSAAFAADGYARIAGRIGVCDSLPGPGATNLVSGLAEAFCSSIPILAIVGDLPRAWGYRRNRGSATQGIDQAAILRPCTKWYGRLEDSRALEPALKTALRIATSGRPGPVVIEVPEDVFREAGEEPDWDAWTPRETQFPRFRMAPDPDVVLEVARLISGAQRPVLVAGGGVLISGAWGVVQRLAEATEMPVVTTITGKGTLTDSHPLSAGVIGALGETRANDLLREADLVLFVGCKVGQLATFTWTLPGPNQTVIQVDVDPEEIGRNYPNALGLVGDAKLSLEAFLRCPLLKRRTGREDWGARICEERRADFSSKDSHGSTSLNPAPVVRAISEWMGPEDILACDASLASGWGASCFRVKRPGRTFLAPRGLTGLGWGAPAAIGARLALGDTPARVVCLAGDGGWSYSMQEVETAVRLDLRILFVVLNNSCLAWAKHNQIRFLHGKTISTDFSMVDYAVAARAMGATGVRVSTFQEFQDAITDLEKITEPAVLEVVCDQAATPLLRAPGLEPEPVVRPRN